jgi:hypothetical protein
VHVLCAGELDCVCRSALIVSQIEGRIVDARARVAARLDGQAHAAQAEAGATTHQSGVDVAHCVIAQGSGTISTPTSTSSSMPIIPPPQSKAEMNDAIN